ncbi:MAG: hypothetical protein ACOY90_11550 [Candidatus Zhuqueibacterota bacterium]
MSLVILYAIAAGVLFALMGLGYKIAEQHKCRPVVFSFVFSLTGGIISLITSFYEVTHWDDPRLWAQGIVMGVLLVIALLLILEANRIGPASVSWTILNLSLLVPILISPLFFHDQVLLVDPFIVLFFVIMLLLFAHGMRVADTGLHRANRRFLLLLIIVFMSNGLFITGNKLKYVLFGNDNTAGLATIAYAVTAIIVLIIALKNKLRPMVSTNEVKIGILVGIFSSSGTIFFIKAMSLPATVVFPLTQGISLLGGVVLTAWIYKERLNKLMILGFGIGFLVLMLEAFRAPLSAMLQF